MSKKNIKTEESTYRKYAPFLNNSYNLYAHIYLTHKALFMSRYSEIKGLGITPMELALLTIVNGHGGSATPAEISQLIMRNRSTVSGLLNRMERNGLIKRSGYENNKKLRKVTITRKGQDALDQTGKSDVLNEIVGALSDEEFKQLWLLLEKLQGMALNHTA
jgi:DNA-binding MarR family transcriptional regulator